VFLTRNQTSPTHPVQISWYRSADHLQTKIMLKLTCTILLYIDNSIFELPSSFYNKLITASIIMQVYLGANWLEYNKVDRFSSTLAIRFENYMYIFFLKHFLFKIVFLSSLLCNIATCVEVKSLVVLNTTYHCDKQIKLKLYG